MRHLAILNQAGEVLGYNYFEEGNEPEFYTDVLPTETFVKPMFDGVNYYEGASEDEINEATTINESEDLFEQFNQFLISIGKNPIIN